MVDRMPQNSQKEEHAYHFHRSHMVKDCFSLSEGTKVDLLGWLFSKSSVGGVLFAILRDGSGTVQIAAKRKDVDPASWDLFKNTNRESAVYVSGKIRVDARAPGGREVSVETFRVVAPAEKWPITVSALKSPSFLYDIRHLAIRGPRASSVIKIRSEVVSATFDFFYSRGFTLISAPSIVQNAVEGGSTLFELDYFGKPAYLSQSAQLYEEAAICALDKVFVFQPAFRAEKSKTSKHLTEFWMIEAEQAFTCQEDNLKLQEQLVEYICNRVSEKRNYELKVLGRKFRPPTAPFPRITYDEVREMASSEGMGFGWGEDVPTEVERRVSKKFDTPFFVTDFPLSARAFYHMTYEDRPKVTISADMYAPEGYGEIATGGQRIHEHADLEERVRGQELPAESFDWYLDLRKYGLPPHTGFGLGTERTTRWICGLKHIRATSLFPRTLTRIRP
jgi:asparaginyl-tRNA synthetase